MTVARIALCLLALGVASCGPPQSSDPRNTYDDPEMAKLLAEKDRIAAEEDARCPLGQRNRTSECESVQRSRDAQSELVGLGSPH